MFTLHFYPSTFGSNGQTEAVAAVIYFFVFAVYSHHKHCTLNTGEENLTMDIASVLFTKDIASLIISFLATWGGGGAPVNFR